MPRLDPIPSPARTTGGYAPSPIDPDYDRYYVLDADGRPVRGLPPIYSLRGSHEGESYCILDDLGERARWGAAIPRTVARLPANPSRQPLIRQCFRQITIESSR